MKPGEPMYSLSAALVISTNELWEETQSALQKLPVRIVLEQSEAGDPALLLEKLDRMNPDIVFLDLSAAPGNPGELIRRIKSVRACPDVVAIHSNSDPQTILSVIRAGAAEYLYPPLSPNLEQALDRIAIERRETRETNASTGRNLGFVSAKGGCGATTLTCHAAVALSRQVTGETLLVDLDLSAGIVRLLMKSKSRFSVVDALNNVQRLDASYWKAIVTNGTPGLEIVGGPGEIYPPEAPASASVRQMLRFARSQYAWILADLGHGSSNALFSALDELDEIFLVTTLEVPALYQAKRMIESLNSRGHGRNLIRLIVNRLPRRMTLTFKEVEKITGLPVYAGIPNDYQALYEAYSGGDLLPENNAVSRKIAALAAKIAGTDSERPRKNRIFSMFS